MRLYFLLTTLAVLFFSSSTSAAQPRVEFDTSAGKILIELDPERAPITVANFLQYVDEKFYDGTLFHRVIDGFMIQGGGFDEQLQHKATRTPIQNEAANGLKNRRLTIAMARTGQPHSATAQFSSIPKTISSWTTKPPAMILGVTLFFGKVIGGLRWWNISVGSILMHAAHYLRTCQ